MWTEGQVTYSSCNLLINTYLLFYLTTLTPTSHILHLYLTTYFVATIISIPPLHTPTHQYCWWLIYSAAPICTHSLVATIIFHSVPTLIYSQTLTHLHCWQRGIFRCYHNLSQMATSHLLVTPTTVLTQPTYFVATIIFHSANIFRCYHNLSLSSQHISLLP